MEVQGQVTLKGMIQTGSNANCIEILYIILDSSKFELVWTFPHKSLWDHFVAMVTTVLSDLFLTKQDYNFMKVDHVVKDVVKWQWMPHVYKHKQSHIYVPEGRL